MDDEEKILEKLIPTRKEIGEKLVRSRHDKLRMLACGWISAFFFNSHSRRLALEDWEEFRKCLSCLSSMTLAQGPRPDESPLAATADELDRELDRVYSCAGVITFSECSLLKPRDSEIDDYSVRMKIIEPFEMLGISINPGFMELADTIPAEFALLQALIGRGDDEKEQARFFFGHVRPLAAAASRAIRGTTDNKALLRVADCMDLLLATEESLYKAGFDGTPATKRTLN